VLIAALGDAHLGRAYYPVTTPEGVNQRERDFELSFEAAVDLALAQEPGLVVLLGDVFDHPRPSYRSFRVVQRALARIRDHGVTAVVITGNHDTPRLPGTGSPYGPLADGFPEHRFAYRLSYEAFSFPGLVIHCVPQMLTVEQTLEALDEVAAARGGDRVDLLLTHPRVPQVEPRYADINEIEVDAGRLRADLALLGHYHVPTRVGEGVWYAGSTDSFSFADDPEVEKGIVTLDTDTGAWRHLPLSSQRPLVTLPTVEALGLSPSELAAGVLSRLEGVPEGAVARLYLEGVDPEAYRLLDSGALKEAGKAALWCKIEPRFVGASAEVELVELDAMPARWARYVAGQDLTGFDRDRIAGLGRRYLDRAVEEAGMRP
jgi:DNA repair exonuclease SbcCD nuclease subunit